MISANVVAYRSENVAFLLKAIDKYYDKIRLINGASDPTEIRTIIKRFSGIEYYEHQFDFPIEQFNFLLSKSSVGEWWMYISDDELPSEPVLHNLPRILRECEADGNDCVFFPFINIRDYAPTLSVVDKMQSVVAYYESSLAKKYNITVEYNWTALRLLKHNGRIFFVGAVHEGVHGYAKPKFVEYPILHYKAYDGFVLSALWQCAVDSSKDSEIVKNIPKEIRDELLVALKESGIELNADSIESHLKAGKVSISLEDWIRKNKYRTEDYIFAWYIYYFLDKHPEKIFPNLDARDLELLNSWKSHILANNKQITVLGSKLHPIVKDWLLSKGVTVLTVNKIEVL